MRKYPYLTVHVCLYFIPEHPGAHLSEDLLMEPGQAACAWSQGRRVSMAGLWTADSLTGQGRMTTIMLQQAKEQPHGSFQLTQSIYT